MGKAGAYFSIKNRGIWHRLFQASSWRRAYRYYGPFEEMVVQVSREDCMRLARANVYMAHRINRVAPTPHQSKAHQWKAERNFRCSISSKVITPILKGTA